MNKELFDVHMQYRNLENELYSKLEQLLGMEKADQLLDDFVDYREQSLKIGKHIDEDKHVGRIGFLTEKYEDFERYLRVVIIYNYDNGYSLCETTTGLIKLIPMELISFESD